MSGGASLATFEGAGWAFRLDAGKVKATPPLGAGEADISALRAHRDTIHAELISRQAVAPCPADLWHDAATIAQDNACSWPDALDGAAVGLGFASHAAFVQAVLDEWRAAIRTAKPATDTGRQAVADALAMLDDFGGDLCAQGWGAVGLFGHDPQRQRHGLAFHIAGGEVEVVASDSITYRGGAFGLVSRFNRMSTAGDAVPFWELNQ